MLTSIRRLPIERLQSHHSLSKSHALTQMHHPAFNKHFGTLLGRAKIRTVNFDTDNISATLSHIA